MMVISLVKWRFGMSCLLDLHMGVANASQSSGPAQAALQGVDRLA
jgi:hypothetical protein